MADDGVCSGDADNGFVGDGAEGVVKECGYASCVMGFGLTAKRVVGKRDRWRAVRIDGVREATPCVIGVVGYYAASPDTL